MADEPQVSPETREAERQDAQQAPDAGRMPTPEEEAAADSQELDPAVAAAAREQYERGADVKGEGQITPD